MKAGIDHIYLYVSDLKKSFDFYNKFLTFLGYENNFKEDWGFAFKSGETSIWFEKAREGYIEKGYHRKRIGLNHLAFKVDSKGEVDKFYNDFLKQNNIPTLYNTPKSFPEYSDSYYAVFFEDPDRIKLEVTYHS